MQNVFLECSLMAPLWHLLAVVAFAARCYCDPEPVSGFEPENDFEPVTLHRILAPGGHIKREDHIEDLFTPKPEASWSYLNCNEPQTPKKE